MKQKNGMEETQHIIPRYQEALFDGKLSFVQGYIYAETSDNKEINAYFRNNLEAVKRVLGKTFTYLPALVDDVEQIVEYNWPGANPVWKEKPKADAAWVQDVYREILSYRIDDKGKTPELPLQTSELPVLMRKEREESRGVVFKLFPLRYDNDVQFTRLLEAISRVPRSDSGIRCSTIIERPSDHTYSSSIVEENENKIVTRCSRITEGKPMNVADDARIDELADEIRQRIEQLKLMGVSEFVIRKLIDLPEPRLSRLVITEDYRIVLPDYNNMEINMPTLSKVVYFFYLRHPEGLSFKELADHRQELLRIYSTISNRDDLDKLGQSIDELVDCTRNSINEKCSRIRSAFVSRFSDDLAKRYYITHGSELKKVITLDRGLVTDEAWIMNGKI